MAHGDAVLWRIAKETPDYTADDLSGGGAQAVGGRWNRKGTAAVYASSTIALATLETRVHLGGNIAIRNAFLVCITVPALLWHQRKMSPWRVCRAPGWPNHLERHPCMGATRGCADSPMLC
jgi:hypothetical protein